MKIWSYLQWKKIHIQKFSKPLLLRDCYRSRDLLVKGAQEVGTKRIIKSDKEPKNQLEIKTNKSTLIKPLEPKDCAFDSSDELDLVDLRKNAKDVFEKSEPTQEKEEKSQNEEEEEKLKESCPLIQEQCLATVNKTDGENEMNSKKEETNDCEYHQLLAHELDELNSSFSSEDWPSLSGDPDFDIF